MAKRSARRAPGEGGLYQRSDGLWVGSVDLGFTAQGKRRRKTVTSRSFAAAQRKLITLKAEVDRVGPESIATTSPTVEQWLTRWLRDIAAPRVRPRTLDSYRHKVTLITAAIGRIRLDRLSPAHVRQVHQHVIAAGLSSTTALNAHRILSKSLTDAEREGLVTRNVATLVDAPRKAVSDRTALSAPQARTLLASAAAAPLASRWAFALLYGARQGECLGLRWDAIDTTAGTIDLAWQLQRLTFEHGCGPKSADGWPCERKRAAECPKARRPSPAGFESRPLAGGLVLTRPKTTAGIRVLPLIPVMADLLEHRAALAAAEPNPHGLVWARPDGRPIDPRADAKDWHNALVAAQLPPVPLHSARHTTATLLLEAGVDAAVCAQILGHSDVIVTRGYQHVSRDLAASALEGLGRSITA